LRERGQEEGGRGSRPPSLAPSEIGEGDDDDDDFFGGSNFL